MPDSTYSRTTTVATWLTLFRSRTTTIHHEAPISLCMFILTWQIPSSFLGLFFATLLYLNISYYYYGKPAVSHADIMRSWSLARLGAEDPSNSTETGQSWDVKGDGGTALGEEKQLGRNTGKNPMCFFFSSYFLVTVPWNRHKLTQKKSGSSFPERLKTSTHVLTKIQNMG